MCDKELLSDSDVDVGGLSQFVYGETPVIIISDTDQSSDEVVGSSMEAGGCVLAESSPHSALQVTDSGEECVCVCVCVCVTPHS